LGADGQLGDARDAERLELRAVLSSQTFARSQRLVKLLEYIAERHFLGQAEQVCEYTIATEVLGRPSDFDPAEDAIARVEIHRLRKKLRDYYATEGVNRPLKMIIPPGMYTPVFQHEGGGAGSRAPDTPTEAPINGMQPEAPAETVHQAPGEPGPALRRKIWLPAALTGMALAAAGVAAWRTGAAPRLEEPPRVPPPAVAIPGDSAMRIIAGYDRAQYIDHHGHTWLGDRFFEGGGRPAAPFRQFIARTCDPILYQHGRIGVTAYNVPLKPGTYEMKLHFVEPVYGPGLETGGGENSRVFDVSANGKMLLDSFDIVSDAGGPNVADVRVFKDIRPGPDGYLHVTFHPTTWAGNRPTTGNPSPARRMRTCLTTRGTAISPMPSRWRPAATP